MTSKEQFRRTDELHGRVIDARVVAMYSPELIEIDDHGNRIGIEDARALRDWLNKALPESPHEPPAALTMEQIERLCVLLDHDPIMARDYAAVRQWFDSVRPSQPPAAEYKIGDRVNHCGHITEVVGVSVKYMLCGGAVVYGHDLQLYSTATKRAGHIYSPREGTEVCGICGFHKREHAPEHMPTPGEPDGR